MTNKFKKRSLTLAMGLLLSASPLYAAEEQDEEEVKDDNVSVKLVILGSRAAPRSVADSPVPIDVISNVELSMTGSVDMLDMIQTTVPSFNVRAQPISDAATLIRPVNLRGLSSDSTLILLNGKRRHRASVIAFQGGGVNDGAQGPDISVIPSIALKQVEVLRDGAAAQYGSDAIAGVMNFVLKDDSSGGSFSVKQGEYFEGDGDTTVFDGNLGLPFTERGFVNLSFQLKNADSTSRSVQRGDAAGLINAGFAGVGNPAQVWGNPEVKDDITMFANVGLDLGDGKEFYMFGNYSERDATGGFYYRNPTNRDNVYSNDDGVTLLVGDETGDGSGNCPVVTIPYNADGSVGDLYNTPEYLAVAASDSCWTFNEMFPGGYTPQFAGNITDTSFTAGTKGDIKSGFFKDYHYDLSGSVGRSESKFFLRNTVNPSMGSASPNDFNTGTYIQLEKALNFDLVKTVEVNWAEDLTVASGLEWREESFEVISGDRASWEPGPLRDQGFSIGSHGFAGFEPDSQGVNTRRSIAGYVDMEAQITENFMMGTALRYEDYTSFGSTTDYKFTAQYNVNDDLSFRGSLSTGFRAPTVGQANVVNTQTSLVDGELVQSATFPPTHPLSAYYDGVELTPEESFSYSFGMVYEAGDFFLTVDYYNIEVSDRIAQTDKIDVEEDDYAALRLLGISNPELIQTVTYFANDFDTTTQGLDIAANYTTAILSDKSKLSFVYNWNETTVDSFSDATGAFKVRRLEEGIPKHRASFTLTESWNDLSMFVRANYFGSYFAVHADENHPAFYDIADSAVTVDVDLSYTLNPNFTFSGGATNIFDQEAQRLQPGIDGVLGASYYESGPFDYNGGYYYFKVTYNF